jgi:Anti-sigma factor NepR
LAGTDSDDFADAAGGKRSNGEMSRSRTDRRPKSGNASTPLDAVSAALRQAYESTVDEAIPDSFMDLLNKLD